MRSSATAFDLVSNQEARSNAREAGGRRTPLFRLGRTTREVWVKREGRQGSGSFHDRVVRHQLRTLSPDRTIVVVGWTAHTIALLAATRLPHRDVEVIDVRSSSRRLQALGHVFAPSVQRVSSPEEASALVAERVAAGAVWLRPDDRKAVCAALEEVRDELEAEGLTVDRFQRVVMPSLGVPRAAVAQSLGVSPQQVELLEVSDDEPTELEADVACRRVQLGHREGLLVSPSGAAVIDRAIDRSVDRDLPVLALLLEDGHRHLGWW